MYSRNRLYSNHYAMSVKNNTWHVSCFYETFYGDWLINTALYDVVDLFLIASCSSVIACSLINPSH